MTEGTAAHSYRPGQWYAVFGERATVLLPPSEKHRVAGLWGLVDDGAGFDEVLDALISPGLRELAGFVLVSRSADQTMVVIRGAARARFVTAEGEVEVEGSGVTTWAERTLRGVTSFRVVLDPADQGADPERADGTGGHDYPIESGLVRVSEVTTPAPDEPAETDEPGEPDEPDLPDEPDVPDERDVPDVPDDLPDTGPQTAEDAVPPAAVAGTPPAPPMSVGQWATDGEEDHDGLTGGRPDPPAPETADEPDPPVVVSRPVARLVFSHGDEVEVDRTVLVGRAPEARRFASGAQPRLVTVPSPAQEISSTHLEIRPGSGADHGTAVITDLGSTNGTVLVQPGLVPEDMRPGVAVQLIPGAIVDLGDGVTIQVINP